MRSFLLDHLKFSILFGMNTTFSKFKLRKCIIHFWHPLPGLSIQIQRWGGHVLTKLEGRKKLNRGRFAHESRRFCWSHFLHFFLPISFVGLPNCSIRNYCTVLWLSERCWEAHLIMMTNPDLHNILSVRCHAKCNVGGMSSTGDKGTVVNLILSLIKQFIAR